MKISKIDDPKTQMIQQYQNGQKVEDKAPDKQVSGSMAPTEKVNLSTTAKDVQRIKSEIEKLPEVPGREDPGAAGSDRQGDLQRGR